MSKNYYTQEGLCPSLGQSERLWGFGAHSPKVLKALILFLRKHIHLINYKWLIHQLPNTYFHLKTE